MSKKDRKSYSLIRHLAVTPDGSLIAAAEFEKLVHIYDIRTRKLLRTFETTLDFGGRRLALSHDDNFVLVGAYRRHGVACYSLHGKEQWRRKDLKNVQQITTTKDQQVFCCFDSRPCEVLDLKTGETESRLRGVRKVYFSSDNIGLFVMDKGYVIRREDDKPIQIEKRSWAVLDAVFSPTAVLLTEAVGAARCLCTKTGAELWSFKPPQGWQFLRLTYCPSRDVFFGVFCEYMKTMHRVLVSLPISSGKPNKITDLELTAETEFISGGTRLALSEGTVVDCLSGKVLRGFKFPRPLKRTLLARPRHNS